MTETLEGAPSAGAGGNGEEARRDAFISYSHHDREFAVRLRAALEGRGQNIWLDESEIHGGSRWSDELERAIDGADTFVFLISPDSASSPECGKELEHAIELSKRILPIRVRETPLDDLPKGLTAYQLIPARELFDSNFEQSLEQLVTEIEVDRDWVREHTDWNEKAREWQKNDRNSSYLLAGAELDLAEQFRGRSAGKQPGLSALQNEYIDASRRGATRRLRRTRAFVSVALLVAIALSVIALIQRQHAISAGHKSSADYLSAESDLQLGTDPQLSLLLAGQAAKTAETPAALDALRRAIPANHLIRTFQADGSPLDGAQLSPDDSRLLTESEDGYARLWSVATGRVLRRFPTATSDEGSGGSFNSHGNQVLLWSQGGIKIWSLASPAAPPVTISDPSLFQLNAAILSPDGSTVATSSGPGSEGTYTLWNAHTGQHVRTLAAEPRQSTGGGIAFSPDGRLLATGSQEGFATIWDVSSGQPLHTLDVAGGEADLAYVPTVAFSPNGSQLLVGAGSPPLPNPASSVIPELSETWDVANGRPLHTFNGGDPAWDQSGSYVVTTDSDGIARVWDATKTQKVVADLTSSYPTTGQAIFAPEQTGQIPVVATGSGVGFGATWNAFSGIPQATFAGDTGAVNPAGFVSNGNEVLTYSSDGATRLWGAGTLTPTTLAPPNSLNFTPTGVAPSDLLSPLEAVSVGDPAALHVLDVHTKAVVATLPAATGLFYDAVAFDPAGHRMLVMSDTVGASSTRILPAQLRLAHGGALLHTLPGPGGLATGGALSPNGQLAATIDRADAITVWAVGSGRKLAVFNGHVSGVKGSALETAAFRFSPDSRLIVSDDNAGRSFVWEARTGRVLNSIQGPAEPASGMFGGPGGVISSNDRLAVTYSGWDGTAHVYRVGQARELIALRGTETGLFDAAFTPDSSLLATAAENQVSFWDTSSPSPILTIPSGTFGPTLQFATNGRSVITGGGGFVTESFPCTICGGFPELLAAARARETRGFTPAERALYLGGG